MIKRFLIALLLIVPLISEAQTSGVDTLRWSVSGFRDLNTSADVVSASEFLISGSGKIKWIQDGGNFVIDWNITSVVGTWADIDEVGSQTYHFADERVQGALIASRTSTGLSMELSMTGGPSPFHLRFSVANVQQE
ncbi:MAG TPA: hypothetical protein PLM56_12875 [Cyclobacteriaceae bacterium]|nr:hypothetical protein [Cyclobacteriaceae bacterium]